MPMEFYISDVLVVGIAVAAMVVVQLMSMRVRSSLPVFVSLLAGLFTGTVVLVICHFGQFKGSIESVDFWAWFGVNLLIFGSLGYLYFHFVNIGEASVRIRILNEIFESADGMAEAEILKRYNGDLILEARLSRLLSSRQISIDEKGRYFSGPRRQMLFVAKAFQILKRIALRRDSRNFFLAYSNPVNEDRA